MSKETLKANLREIPDFPIPGILFYDVTTLFKNAECLQEMLDTLYEMYKDKGITKVVGIESRGFIMGGALAARLGAGFVMARKPGKLPAEVVEETYAKEYGTDTIQIHKDAINENDVVLLHDVFIGYRWNHGGHSSVSTKMWCQKDLHQLHYRVGRSERQKGIPRRHHSGYTAYFITPHNLPVKKRSPSRVTIERQQWMDNEKIWTMKPKDIYLQAVTLYILQLEDL